MNSEEFDPGPLAQISCSVEDKRSTLVFVRDLPHIPELVWATLTEPKRLQHWSPFNANRNLATSRFATLRAADDTLANDLPAAVAQAIAPMRLAYSWGADLLAWELAAVSGGTQVLLRHTVESSDWIPALAAGWHICLVAADRLLDGRPIGPIVGHRSRAFGWDRLHDAYAAKLGVPGTGWPYDLFPCS